MTHAQFVQESVPERLPLKLDLYRELEPALAPDAQVATSASGLLLADAQAGFADPGRFFLGHPLSTSFRWWSCWATSAPPTACSIARPRLTEERGKVTIRVRK